MKVSTLLKLARQDNPTLAQHALWWVSRKRDQRSDKKPIVDPVSTALAWDDKRKVYLRFGLILMSLLTFLTYGCITWTHESFIAHFCSVFIPVVLGAVTLTCFACAITARMDMPSEVRSFLMALTLLEKSKGRRDANHQVYCHDPLGKYPAAPDWAYQSELATNAKRLLVEEAQEIVRLQEKENKIPWRAAKIGKLIAEKKAAFGQAHYVLKTLLDIPQHHEFYYKNSGY